MTGKRAAVRVDEVCDLGPGLAEPLGGVRLSAAIEAGDGDADAVVGPADPADGRRGQGGEGTDFHAVDSGSVSITPLQIDLTNRDQMPAVTQWLAPTAARVAHGFR